MALAPNRENKIVDKLLAIEMRAKKIGDLAYEARHLPSGREEEMLNHGRQIIAIANELWTILNTPDERGKKWGWWD